VTILCCSRMKILGNLAGRESLSVKKSHDCVRLIIKVREISVFIVTGYCLSRDKGLLYSERLG
jgi:hypothetical protein